MVVALIGITFSSLVKSLALLYRAVTLSVLKNRGVKTYSLTQAVVLVKDLRMVAPKMQLKHIGGITNLQILPKTQILCGQEVVVTLIR